MAVANNLKQILKDKGIKQSWLAEQVDITPTTLGNIVHNRFNTSLEVALRIAIVLNIRVEEIFRYVKE